MTLLTLCLLLLVASPVSASAQGFTLGPQVDITYITNTLNGFDYVLSSTEAWPANPGREVLFWVPAQWRFTVGRWHPAKHGVGGAIPGPGLCLESWNYIEIRGNVWHFQAVGDFVGGDGIDDFLIYLPFGSVLDPYQGVGLTVCR